MPRDFIIPRKKKQKFLKKYLNLKASISRLEHQQLEIEKRLNAPEPLDTDDHQELQSRHDSNQLRIIRLKRKATATRSIIEDAIDGLDDIRQATILEKVYLQGLDMCDIADSLGYSVRHIYRIYIDAISTIKIKTQ